MAHMAQHSLTLEELQTGLISAASFSRYLTSESSSLAKPGNDGFGRHYLPVNHVEQLTRIKAEFRAQLIDVGISCDAECADML
jgi:hypothetical protein